METRFKDRREAGTVLAGLLGDHVNRRDVVVFALPPGGVPVAFEIAKVLRAPLDVLVTRKLNVPQHDAWQDEIVMGAVAPVKTRVLNTDVVKSLQVRHEDVEQVTVLERQELARLETFYRGDRPVPDLSGRTAILVSDAVVTGTSMRAAIQAVRGMGAARVVIAAPVAAAAACGRLEREADQCLCALKTGNFCSLALWYTDPRAIPDSAAKSLLDQHANPNRAASATSSPSR
jgi:putative phosphoribosyl transferase